MDQNQTPHISQKPSFWLSILLFIFMLKGVILSDLFPFFQQPDEQTHYATIQYLSEPTKKIRSILKLKKTTLVGSDISTYGFSEEVIQSAQATQFDQIKFENQNIPDFLKASEAAVIKNNWKRHLDTTLSNVSGTKSIYYLFGSWLERLFSDQSIFVRLFSMRMLAVLFGTGTIFLAYRIARKVGFSQSVSLLFTTLVAFQPMLSATAAQVNIDIALIFAFSLFLYAGVSFLKDGLSFKSAPFAIFAAILGLFSKGPGVVLIAVLYPLFAWGAYKKLGLPRKKFLLILVGVSVLLGGIAFILVPQSYLMSITNASTQSTFSSPLVSISKYLNKTITTGGLHDTALSYWGQFGWLDSSIPDWSLSIIILITIIGFIGTIWYLFSQKKLTYLPERKYLIFSLGMIVVLQVAIRFYDWRIFDYTEEILIGQPGRYFLPNIIAHLLIVITGIGFFLRQETRFVLAMKILTLAMILLQLHVIVNVIIPRYYL